jgi:hypothetical protein
MIILTLLDKFYTNGSKLNTDYLSRILLQVIQEKIMHMSNATKIPQSSLKKNITQSLKGKNVTLIDDEESDDETDDDINDEVEQITPKNKNKGALTIGDPNLSSNIPQKLGDYYVSLQYVDIDHNSRPRIALNGKDESFINNYLIKEFGTTYKFNDLKIGQVIRARMRDPETVNFGIFLDCGITDPNKDVLLPIHAMRRQLVNGKPISKRNLTAAYGFFENMPISVKITKKNFAQKQIECEFADDTLNMFNNWLDDGFEILFSTGMPRKQIKKAIKKTKHYPDYISIDRLGFLETAMFLKKGTHSPGILAEIGPLLNNVKFSMLRPSKVRHLLESE